MSGLRTRSVITMWPGWHHCSLTKGANPPPLRFPITRSFVCPCQHPRQSQEYEHAGMDGRKVFKYLLQNSRGKLPVFPAGWKIALGVLLPSFFPHFKPWLFPCYQTGTVKATKPICCISSITKHLSMPRGVTINATCITSTNSWSFWPALGFKILYLAAGGLSHLQHVVKWNETEPIEPIYRPSDHRPKLQTTICPTVEMCPWNIFETV